MNLSSSVRATLRLLARDHLSGSAELARRVCAILEQASRELPPAAQDGMERLRQVACAVAGTQPSMAAVLNVSNRWLLAAQQGESPVMAARRLSRQLRESQKAAAALTSELVKDGDTVLTYSASSTVLAALLLCRRQKIRFRVLCSESRPQMEGRLLAGRLAERGVRVEMLTDAALFSETRAADLVLVGCDAVLSGSFVNKAGTGALLCMARRSRTPCYVVADTFKFLPRALEPWFRVREEAAAEVWKSPPRRVTVHNRYFEKVPLRNLTAVVTEEGVWPLDKVRAYLRNLTAAAGLEKPC